MLCEMTVVENSNFQLSVTRNEKFGNEQNVIFNKMCVLALLLIEDVLNLWLDTDIKSRKPWIDSFA